MGWVALLVGLAAAVGHLMVPAEMPWLAVALKPVPVWVLAALAVGGRAPGRGWLLLGLLLSSAGDLLLEWPGDHFIEGLVAFLLAHVAYVAAFWARAGGLLLGRALPFVLYGVVVFAVLGPSLGALALPVGVYACAISAMGWRSAALLGVAPPVASLLALFGALSFIASDSLLAVHRFHTPLGDWASLAIMLTYWVGQLGIAASFWVDE